MYLLPTKKILCTNGYLESEMHQQLFDELSNDDYWEKELRSVNVTDGDPTWHIISQRLEVIEPFEKKKRSLFPIYYSSAALIVAGVLGFYLWKDDGSSNYKENDIVATVNTGETDIMPAGTKATLKLGDGSIVKLDRAEKRMPGMERNGMFIAVENESLISHTERTARFENHVLSHSKAGQYKVVLPDGTSVWLNAASSLKFPTVFTGSTRGYLSRYGAVGSVVPRRAHGQRAESARFRGRVGPRIAGDPGVLEQQICPR